MCHGRAHRKCSSTGVSPPSSVCQQITAGASLSTSSREFVPASPSRLAPRYPPAAAGSRSGRAVLPYDRWLATVEDIVHGSAIASLIDAAGVAAASSHDERPDSLRGSTAGLNVSFVAGARRKDLVAAALVVKALVPRWACGHRRSLRSSALGLPASGAAPSGRPRPAHVRFLRSTRMWPLRGRRGQRW
jgi:acyl-coenzyme A thioesterase PaaI-like protein